MATKRKSITGNENKKGSMLSDAVQKYVKDKVVRPIPAAEKRELKAVANSVKEAVENYITEKKLEQDFGEIKIQESSYEGLKVLKGDEYDLLVPVVDSGLDAVEVEELNGCNVSGYSFIEKTMNHATRLDGCVVDGNLNPTSTIRQEIMPLVQGVTSKMNGSATNMTLDVSGPSLILDVKYSHNKSLSINVVPCIEIDGDYYCAKMHPNAEMQNSFLAPGQNKLNQLWRKSYTKDGKIIISEKVWENKYFRTLQDIMLTAQNERGSYQLGRLQPQHLKSCMLHLINETDIEEWHQDNLHLGFKDVHRTLLKFLENGKLPDYYNPSKNLLEQYPPDSLHNIKCWLRINMASEEKIIDNILHAKDSANVTTENYPVFVKTPEGKTKTISDMKNTTYVWEFEKKVEEKTGIPPGQQGLIFGRKRLQGSKTLGQCGIVPESNIYMNARLRGG